ncbi:YppE family protein [Thermaerobacillus caldiproteolyticus]|uniref:YppE family protein n=1 Tax=Thermaerobacillus caldiproteolyticus TaxID=247480 RepID=UPI00188A4A6C|nr:YppE family protein [Anoxybacillus caldiproteolyticus]QPA32946.1 YppE family protein [Anoxybacillus caldiproteolyticus]
MHKQLEELTKQLQNYNDEILQIAEQTRHHHESPDFFGTVKPFVDEVKQVVDEWKRTALAWIQSARPKYVYPQQIETTGENIEKIAIEAFYPNAKISRIKQFHQSIEYTLLLVCERLKENE